MASEVEKQTKLVAELEARAIELENTLTLARTRKALLAHDHQALHERHANGDSGAKKELLRLKADVAENDVDVEAFFAALATTQAKLTAAKKALLHAQETADGEQLEAASAEFLAFDRDELQPALRVVAEKTGALIHKVTAVGARLTLRDEKKYGHLAPALITQIRRSIFFFIEEMHKPNAEPRPTFSDSVSLQMRRIIAELRFELAGRTMQPTRGEKLYRVIVACPGVRDCDCRPGDHVALRPDEPLTIQLVKSRTIELFDENAKRKTEAALVAEGE